MKDLISVILPIYNVEKYLNRSLEAVINQTYTNIEIILVDDGSPDNCGKICDEYAKKDPRIKVIHKENGGLSDARNVGLRESTGKYICFIDSDDYVEVTYIEELYNLLKENNAKISICNFAKVDENEKFISKNTIKATTLTGRKLLEEMNNKKIYVVFPMAWGKLYDAKLFDDIVYPIGKLHEDEFIIHKLYYKSEKVAITSKVLYFYRVVPTSITNSQFNEKRLDALDALEQRVRFFRERGEEKLYRLALIGYQSVLITNYINCKLYIEKSEKLQRRILDKYRENHYKVIKSKECSIKNKIKFIIANINPMLFYNIRRFFKMNR